MHESVDINYLSITGMYCWLIVIGCNHVFREFSILHKYTSAALLQQQLSLSLVQDLCTSPTAPSDGVLHPGMPWDWCTALHPGTSKSSLYTPHFSQQLVCIFFSVIF